MTLATFSDLKTAIGDWMIDTGATLAARYGDFIALAENRFNYGANGGGFNMPPLRVAQMEDTISLALDANGEAVLPADFLEARTVETATSGASYGLEPQTPGRMTYDYPTRYGATAAAYSLRGGSIRISPTSGPVTLRYYAKIPALSEAAPTNWLITAFPNVYLRGALLEACIYNRDESYAAQQASLLAGELSGLATTDRSGRWGRSTARVMGPTP